jgi:4-amino-4-deoxy-L-arabinose transferase-like glycosyltransferase
MIKTSILKILLWLRSSSFSEKRQYYSLGTLFFISLIIRIIVSFSVGEPPTAGDATQYQQIAKNISCGNGFMFEGLPSAYRPPIYPLFLAIIYYIFGDSYFYIYFFQSLIGSTVVIITYFIGKSIFSSRIGVLSSAIMALHPAQIFSTSLLLTEILNTFLLCLAFLSIIYTFKNYNYLLAILSGILLGLSTLCHPSGLLIPLIIFLSIVIFQNEKAKIKLAFLVLIISFTTLAPWTYRNYKEFDEFILISNSSMAFAFWYSNYEPWNLEFRGWDEPPLDVLLEGLRPPQDASKIDSVFLSEAKKNILNNPFSFIKLSIRKSWKLWRPIPGEKHQIFNSSFLFHSLRIYHALLILCMFIGIIFSFVKPLKNYIIFIIILLYWTGIHSIIVAVPRHLLPMMPLVSIFSSIGLIILNDFFKKLKKNISSDN